MFVLYFDMLNMSFDFILRRAILFLLFFASILSAQNFKQKRLSFSAGLALDVFANTRRPFLFYNRYSNLFKLRSFYFYSKEIELRFSSGLKEQILQKNLYYVNSTGNFCELSDVRNNFYFSVGAGHRRQNVFSKYLDFHIGILIIKEVETTKLITKNEKANEILYSKTNFYIGSGLYGSLDVFFSKEKDLFLSIEMIPCFLIDNNSKSLKERRLIAMPVLYMGHNF